MQVFITNLSTFIITVAVLVVSYSCEQSRLPDLPRVYVNVVDSVIFDAQNEFLLIRAFNNDYYLGANETKNKLFLFDSTGKKIKIINNQGDGPLDYKEILNYGLTPSNDIAVFDGTKVLIMGKNGRNCSLDVNTTLPELNDNRLFVDNDHRIIMSSSSMGNPSHQDYFQFARTFTIIDTTCQYKNMGGYPEGNMFRKENYPMGYDVRTWMLMAEPNKVFQLFRWDKSIYVWSSKSDTLIQTIQLSPDDFGEIVQKKGHSVENMIYSIQRNARFIDFAVSDKYILVYYMTGMKEEDVSHSIEQYNTQLDKLVKRKLSLYDRNGTKIGTDFSDERIKYLLGFDRFGRLLFQDEKEDGPLVVYAAKIHVSLN